MRAHAITCLTEYGRRRARSRQVVAVWTWSFDGGRITFATSRKRRFDKKEDMMVEITEEDQVSATVQPRTRKGNPAAFHSDVSWNVSDPDAVELIVDETSPNKSRATFKGKPGAGVRPVDVTAVFDSREGEEIVEITAVGQIVVKDAEALTAEVTFGAVEPQP